MDTLTQTTIKQAHGFLDTGDAHLANYVLRDLPIVKANRDLSDLAWAAHKHGCVKNDVLGLIKDIEAEADNAES